MTGKRVVVIGSGATAVTIVPAVAGTAAHVTMLQRSPSYILPIPARDPVAALLRKVLPERQAYAAVRWKNARITTAIYDLCRKYPDRARAVLRRGPSSACPAGYDVDTHFTPAYEPWDQRMCLVPNGDFFAAIKSGKADIVTDPIEAFTRTGLRLRSGEHLDADVIVTATGLNLLPLGGIDLSVDGEPVIRRRSRGLQGDDARRRAQHGVRDRLHQRLLDAQGRPGRLLRCRLLVYMGRNGYAVVTPRLPRAHGHLAVHRHDLGLFRAVPSHPAAAG